MLLSTKTSCIRGNNSDENEVIHQIVCWKFETFDFPYKK